MTKLEEEHTQTHPDYARGRCLAKQHASSTKRLGEQQCYERANE